MNIGMISGGATSFSTITTPMVPPAPIQQAMVFSLETNGEIAAILSPTTTHTQPIQDVLEVHRFIQSKVSGVVLINADSLTQPLDECLEQLWDSVIGFPAIVVSNNRSPKFIYDLCRAGVSGCIGKPCSAPDLEKVIARVLLADCSGNPSPCELRSRIIELTNREREVLRHCLQGTPTKTIAKLLGVTFQTIDKHRARSLRKMGVGSVLELVYAVKKLDQQSILNYI